MTYGHIKPIPPGRGRQVPTEIEIDIPIPDVGVDLLSLGLKKLDARIRASSMDYDGLTGDQGGRRLTISDVRVWAYPTADIVLRRGPSLPTPRSHSKHSVTYVDDVSEESKLLELECEVVTDLRIYAEDTARLNSQGYDEFSIRAGCLARPQRDD